MDLSVIILSYKMKRLVRNCLRTWYEAGIDIPHELIVVDNDSNDGIEELVKAEFPEVKYLQTKKNLGMGGGNNVGIKAANGRYVLILNPDIYVTKSAIENMYRYLQANPQVGLVAPRLVNPDKSLQYTCYRWYGWLTPLWRRFSFAERFNSVRKHLDDFLMKDFDHTTIKEVDWVQGSCFIMPKRIFTQVGGFDESFFMYFEDTDLCRRLWNNNLKVVYFGTEAVIHLHGKMSNGGLLKVFTNPLTRQHIKSWIKFEIKHRRTHLKNKFLL